MKIHGKGFLDAQGGQRGSEKSVCKEGVDLLRPLCLWLLVQPRNKLDQTEGFCPLGGTCSGVELRLEPHVPDAKSQALQTLHCPAPLT